MYLEHFGLERFPFVNAPDTSLFFPGGGRQKVLEGLVAGITGGKKVMMVSGVPGSGRTMLCRMLGISTPGVTDVIFIVDDLNPNEALRVVAHDLGMDVEQLNRYGSEQEAVVSELHRRRHDNRRIVALVEEAQEMSQETLMALHALSGGDSQTQTLLQIVLFGDVRLPSRLDIGPVRTLKKNHGGFYRLQALGHEDVAAYLQHRLWQTGSTHKATFAPAAVKILTQASGGLFRGINILAHKAMMAAYMEDQLEVGINHIRYAIGDSEYDGRRRFWRVPKRMVPLATGMALLTGLGVASMFKQGQEEAERMARIQQDERVELADRDERQLLGEEGASTPPPTLVPRSVRAETSEVLHATNPTVPSTTTLNPEGGGVGLVVNNSQSEQSVAMPSLEPKRRQEQSDHTVGTDDGDHRSVSGVTQGDSVGTNIASVMVKVRNKPSEMQNSTDAAQREKKARSHRVSENEATGVTSEITENIKEKQTKVQKVVSVDKSDRLGEESAGTVSPKVTDYGDNNRSIGNRVAAAKNWIDMGDRGGYSIHLADLDTPDGLERLYEGLKAETVMASQWERLYAVPLKTHQMAVYLDWYPDLDAALKALDALPESVRKHRPHIQAMQSVRKDMERIGLL
ncbi:MAG: AAA family ATPase [Magnetococcales bacterium]|nr:AAA family ATPase [Magnetococcales bacterium]